jgi:hypothetical protein
MLKEMRCLCLYGLEVVPYTMTIGGGLLLLLIAGIITRARDFTRQKKNLFNTGDSWLFAGVLILILFFKLSDDAGGGMNCARLLHLFVICMIAWLALNAPPLMITLPVLSVILIIQMTLIFIYTPVNAAASAEADEWEAAGAIPEKNSITLPVLFNYTWLNYHCSGYFSAVNARMNTRNYEAALKWFPVIFNKSTTVKLEGQTFDSPFDFVSSGKDPVRVTKTADYVAVWQQPRTAADSVNFRSADSLLKLNYTLRFSTNNIRLFKRNK